MRRAARQILDRPPIAVAGDEVHPREHRVAGERLVHEARRFDEVRPFVRRKQAHAGDQVAHRKIGCGLARDLHLDHGLRARPLGGEPLRKLVQRHRSRRVAVAQPLEQLNRECARPSGTGSGGRPATRRPRRRSQGRSANRRSGRPARAPSSTRRCARRAGGRSRSSRSAAPWAAPTARRARADAPSGTRRRSAAGDRGRSGYRYARRTPMRCRRCAGGRQEDRHPGRGKRAKNRFGSSVRMSRS